MTIKKGTEKNLLSFTGIQTDRKRESIREVTKMKDRQRMDKDYIQ